MSKYTRFSSHAGMAVMGAFFRRLWAEVEQRVQIRQKTRTHPPIQKLLLAVINILAGGQGVSTINTILRHDPALLRALGSKGWVDQSLVSTTLNRCSAQNVEEMRQSLNALLAQHGQCVHHFEHQRTPLLLDIDLTGLLAGRQGEGATKGYFSGHPGSRGRQLVRVLATDYDEVILERLYPGNFQLHHVLEAVLKEVEEILNLTPEQRARTLLRLDAGGGYDATVNLVLAREYLLLTKVNSWSRSDKLAHSVQTWYADPKEPDREWGWPEEPHDYVRETQQIVCRHQRDGKWHYWTLVSNAGDALLSRLAQQPVHKKVTAQERLLLIAYAYDGRGGGVETSFKDSKNGLGLTKRNKQLFAAQEMLVLLSELAYNFLTWARRRLAQVDARWAQYGPLRLIRDVGGIPGEVHPPCFYRRRFKIVLYGDDPLTKRFVHAFSQGFPSTDLRLILYKT